MTHTDPTAAALLRAILLHPADEDTARLVYADWLDEHAGTNGYSPCPECKGEGRPARQYPLLCRKCGGTGLVPASDGFAERAEFIRAQVAIARIDQSETWGSDRDEYRRAEKSQRKYDAHRARRREWFGIPCPVCEGSKRVLYSDAETGASLELGCTDCDGTGFAPVEFRRGFVDRVTCRMGDVLHEQYAGHASGLRIVPGEVLHPREWVLTPWARGVLAAHPVTRWEIVDREPWASHASAYWGWWSENPPHPPDAATLPHVVMAVLAEDSRRCDSNISLRYSAAKAVLAGCVLFAAEAEARDALALAVGRVARRLAGLSDSGTNAGGEA